MKKSTTKIVFRSELFRTPCGVELELGLWVDRIGRDRRQAPLSPPDRLRVLGLHAAVAIVSGRGSFESCSAGLLEVEAGDVISLFPEEPDAYWPEREWEERFVVWGGPEADILGGAGVLSPKSPLLKGASGCVEEAYSRLSSLMESESLLAALDRKVAALDMILKLGRLRGAVGGWARIPESVEAALAALSRTGAEALASGMDGLARECGLSPTHFRRLFKRHTGMSPKSYAMSARVSRAKMLLSGGMAVKEVSEACGFSDVFHFMRSFKAATGSTVAAYTRSLGRN